MNPQTAFLINQSLQSLSNGNFKGAELYLNQALRLEPKNSHVLRFLGVAAAQQSQWEKALDFFKKSIKSDPKNAIAYSNLGNVFLELKQYSDAITNYDKAISINPKDAEIWSNKGNALAALKRYEEALTQYDKALALNPQYAEAWSNKGNALNELKRFEDALLAYKQSISLNQGNAKTWSNVGNSLTELKDYEGALLAYNNATSLNPLYIEAWTNKSILLSLLKQYKEALECCQHALDIDQNDLLSWTNRAAFLTEIHDYSAALLSINKALELDPNYAKAWLNKGSILNGLSQSQEAVSCFERAIQLQPDYADAWANKGVSFYDLLLLEQCIECCNKAIEIDPSHIEGHWTKSFAQLMLGNFDEGWVNYEYRWHRKDADQRPHSHIHALSSLENLQGKKILVWPEQGFGDILQFVRYLPKLAQLGAHVTFEVQEPLMSLLQNQLPCELITKGDTIGQMDFQVPLGSLPLLFKSNIGSIPAETPYIRVSPDKVQEWKDKLPLSTKKLNIGIACSGNINFDLKHGNKRPIPLEHFSELAQQHNLFLIQKEIRDADQVTLHTLNTIHPLGELIKNFEDTAAIVENMDLIISIDTSLVHLAGALGKKVLVLLSWCPDWRWLAEGTTNPWYSTATIFRQPTPGDWKSVMDKVSAVASSN